MKCLYLNVYYFFLGISSFFGFYDKINENVTKWQKVDWYMNKLNDKIR